MGPLPFGFLRLVGFVRSKFLPAGLHGSEGAAFSNKKFVRLSAVLSLLDAPVGCDPAFFVIGGRFRQMRRYLGRRPGEAHRIYRLLDLACRPGHGPAHLLLESAAEIGFAWDSAEEGWLRPGLIPLRMLSGPFNMSRQPFGMLGKLRWRGFLPLVRVSGAALFRTGRAQSSFFSLPT